MAVEFLFFFDLLALFCCIAVWLSRGDCANFSLGKVRKEKKKNQMRETIEPHAQVLAIFGRLLVWFTGVDFSLFQ